MKPDFTGIWEFNPKKSTLQIEPPDSTVMVIDHHEPVFRLSRTHTRSNKSDTLSVDLMTDGRELVLDQGEFHIRGHAYWDSDVLVFDSILTRAQEEATNDVRYTLSGTLNSLIAEETFRSKRLNYHNVWVLDRKKR